MGAASWRQAYQERAEAEGHWRAGRCAALRLQGHQVCAPGRLQFQLRCRASVCAESPLPFDLEPPL